ncbi:5-methyltetrahydropteroyltriglutamate--homocysteine S-methyltransferase [Paenibacillus filicis]|uniref:5-methyltetrahydropteroyltriglutamate--homocysteine methyltransferase n=1 Tax=Paenibacillus filicis TaxID=669464 RepID=A0ABU9DTU3_9BACL
MSNHVQTGSLGYPRIGEQREWKKALESFWAGKTDEKTLTDTMEELRLEQLRRQQAKGLEFVPVNDFTYYDHILDTAVMFGIVPARYGHEGGAVSLATYFAMARGSSNAVASEMTKWFNTNYHYIVPEIGDSQPYLAENKPLAAYRSAKERAGIEGRPVIVGLYTFLKLSKGFASSAFAEKVEQFLPVYGQVLQELKQEGVQWVQIDEPALVQDTTPEQLALVERIYAELRRQVPGLRILVQTYFEAVEHFERVAALPVDAIGLDFVHDRGQHLEALERHGWPQDKLLAAGIIDGRNVWRSDLDAKLELAGRLSAYVPAGQLILQPSSSLLHVPVTVDREDKLGPEIKNALAFADQKLDELALLARAIREGQDAVASELAASREALESFRLLPERNRTDVAERLAGIDQVGDTRNLPFAERFEVQQQKWQLPLLPTTTIGSFPQTKEVRQARQQWRKGSLDDAAYEAFVNKEIESCIRLQEEIGIDVLVHGEFERTDMVEFFGEKLAGFFFTANGWVQSYGSRCVKPPVIYADVAFVDPMTVKESAYAQSLSSRPVKGMLTGPVTILNWSFVRDDMSREQVTNQIALALRHEVEALESAGIEMIQVDEPAVREGLPLKGRDHEAYLNWAVRSFRIATSTVRDTTQIHTHMCYCEFHDMIESIRDMDADVISIETSRSHGELISHFELQGYDHGIGLGVYDIHSPRVPGVGEMTDMIDRALHALDARLFWINPDCGLKTRGWSETEQSLRNMVEAALAARERLQTAPAK